jgi:hypothetical protein
MVGALRKLMNLSWINWKIKLYITKKLLSVKT